MFTLIQLSYAMEALEPVISAETISFHHGKHLQAYVENLNKLLPGSGFEGMALEEIVRQAPAGPVFNNAGQILNHELYFTQFMPASEAAQGPTGALAAQIEKQWGSFEAFCLALAGCGCRRMLKATWSSHRSRELLIPW